MSVISSSVFERILSIYTRQLAGGDWYDFAAKYTNVIPIPDVFHQNLRESRTYMDLVALGKAITEEGVYFYSERINELVETLFGIRTSKSGEIVYCSKPLEIRRPEDAIAKKMALVTEDRRATGIFGVLSIEDNISVASLKQYLKYKVLLNRKKIHELVRENMGKLSIKAPNGKTQIQTLSGGNQQKVIISRWLANDPDILILDEPTRGIDVGAKYEIYSIIAALAEQGKSIIMISSEMGELLGMSDRIMVMCSGRVTGVLDRDEATQESIMSLATQFSQEG